MSCNISQHIYIYIYILYIYIHTCIIYTSNCTYGSLSYLHIDSHVDRRSRPQEHALRGNSYKQRNIYIYIYVYIYIYTQLK